MTEAPCILLVDDEPQIARWLHPTLKAAGYRVVCTESGVAAIDRLALGGVSLVLLDLGLPDMDGQEVIARVREWADTPIIVLSARDSEVDKVRALDLGADDYVNKPVGTDELLARIRVAIRNSMRNLAQSAVFKAGPLRANWAGRRVWIENEEVHLTPREFELLRVLARHAGMVLTHSQIISAVWGAGANTERQHVRVLVSQLRVKLEYNPSRPRLIITDPGVGYRLLDAD